MPEIPPDRRYFTRAVTELGEKRPVLTTRAIFNHRGVKIVEAGVAVNAGLYERLMQHQLDRPLEDSIASTPCVNGRMLREHAQAQLRTFPLFAGMALTPQTQALLLDSVERVPMPAPIAFQLTLAHEVRPELFQHLVVSALLAAWLAMEPKASRTRMGLAAAAGLLHDIGLLHLDPVLLSHHQRLDPAQRRQLYSHPLVSALLIEPHSEYSREVVRGVREHHEFLDGSGYPVGLAGERIGELGRILVLSELVLGSFAPDREAPLQRLSVQLRMNTHRYEETLVQRVLGVLRVQDEAGHAGLALLDDPVAALLTINDTLSAWPAGLAEPSAPPAQRPTSSADTAQRVSQLRRLLAGVGAAPEQLQQLGADELDLPLQTELTLLVREAAWQLGALAQEVRRHWESRSDGDWPAALQTWVERSTQIATDLSGRSAAHLADRSQPEEVGL